MSITCIFRLWEILRAINDRPYEKTGIFSIEDVGALRERPKNLDAEEVLTDRWGRTGSDASAACGRVSELSECRRSGKAPLCKGSCQRS